MEGSTKKIAEAFIEALKIKDWDLMRSILTHDVVWSLPGTSLIAGEAVGADAVISRSQRITSYGVNFGLKHVLYGQFGFALSINNTARRGDLVLDEQLATVCTLRDHVIARIDTYLSDVPMANEFFQ